MKVILNADIKELGHVGDVIEVKSGYARNYLLPRQYALLLNKHNLQIIEFKKKKIAKEIELAKLTAVEQKQKLEELNLVFEKKAGENDTLFGSVTVQEIEEKLTELGLTLDRKKFHLSEPIKRLGNYSCKIKLFEEIEAEVKIEVKKLIEDQ